MSVRHRKARTLRSIELTSATVTVRLALFLAQDAQADSLQKIQGHQSQTTHSTEARVQQQRQKLSGQRVRNISFERR